MSVANLYIRNEDWLNEIIDDNCIICDSIYQKKRRSEQKNVKGVVILLSLFKMIQLIII